MYCILLFLKIPYRIWHLKKFLLIALDAFLLGFYHGLYFVFVNTMVFTMGFYQGFLPWWSLPRVFTLFLLWFFQTAPPRSTAPWRVPWSRPSAPFGASSCCGGWGAGGFRGRPCRGWRWTRREGGGFWRLFFFFKRCKFSGLGGFESWLEIEKV